jgi:DNA-binding CsgD family transcriptional regulator
MFRLQELIDSLLREKTPRSMLDHMQVVLRQFGVDQFVLVRFAQSGEYIDKWLVGWSAHRPKEEWLKAYKHRDDPHADPIIKRSRETVEPFFWSDVVTDKAYRKRVAPFAKEALIVPVPGVRGCVGTMWMGGSSTREQLHRYKPVIQAIGLACYYHLKRHCAPDPADPAPPHTNAGLSGCETEVLNLVAEGLSAPTIGKKLNISDRTVEWHIDKAMKKFGARNRIQAVVLAIRDGLISV